jgi:ankyrin repeat protein
MLWLLDEEGADVNGRAINGHTALHAVDRFDIFMALLDRGADPTLPNDDGMPLLASFARRHQ